jgi:hypothetical protein
MLGCWWLTLMTPSLKRTPSCSPHHCITSASLLLLLLLLLLCQAMLACWWGFL